MNIIFPLGGKGSRFIHQGYQLSKPLINVFGKPIMRYLVERLSVDMEKDKVFVIYYAGVSDFTNGPLQVSRQELQEHVFYHLDWKDIITYIPISTATSGVLETLQMGMADVDIDKSKTTVILDCDIFYGFDVLEVIRKYNQNMLFYFIDHGTEPEYSYLEVDSSDHRIKTIYEKHKISDFANTGIYVFRDWEMILCYISDCVEACAKQQEPYLSGLVSKMISVGNVFYGYEVGYNTVFNLGTPERVDQFKENRMCLLFDLDGTLVLSDHVYFKVWQKMLAEFYIDLSERLYKKNIQGNSDHVVKSRFCLPYSVDQLSRQKDALFETYAEDVILVGGVMEFFEQCFWSAIPTVIVTNCNRASAKMIIVKMGFQKFIHGLVIGNECVHAKPAPDPYRVAIENILATSPTNCVIFEDSKTGILSGSSCNVSMVVGLETSYDPTSLKKLGCDITLKDYHQGLHEIEQQFHDKKRSLDMSGDDIHFALYQKFPNSMIDISNYKLKGGFISDVICFKMHDRFDYILKMENKAENPIRKMAGKLDLYETEYYFYSTIAPTLSISIPKSLGVIEMDAVHGILLENMFSKGNVIHETLDNVPLSTITNYVTTLSQLHLTYWGLDVKTIFPRVRSPGEHEFSWGEYIVNHWTFFYEKWNFMMSDTIKETCIYIVDHFDEIEKYMCKGPRTLCHGDFKAPNIFFHPETRECTIIDWQYVTFGKGAQDLVFFLIESFDISNMTMAFKDYMLSYYFLLIHQQHKDYDYEEFRRDIKMSSYYFPFFVAIWFGTMDIDSLLDKNFPFFFIQRLFHFYELN